MKRKPRPCHSVNQSCVTNGHSEQYCGSMNSICHNNHFEILSVEDSWSDNDIQCDPRIIVGSKGENQCHTSECQTKRQNVNSD